jgi:uncharacterized caspase-like protein
MAMNRFRATIVLVSLWLAAIPALAEKRVALVIGNSAYKHAPALANPGNDARGVAAVLKRLKFDVIEGFDLDEAATRRVLRDLSEKLDGLGKDDVALFFYAGHGLQVNGRNYLVPVDARLERERDLEFQAVAFDFVQNLMEKTQQTNIVILDSCRDNPLARNLARSMGTRSAGIGRGLGQAQAGIGTLIVYATQPGNVALDGQERNSPFTAALLKHLESPGLEVRLVVSRVRQAVIAATGGRQVPWDSSSLTAEVYLARAPEPNPPQAVEPAPPARPGAPSAEYETLFWQSIKDSRNVADFKAYLERYPSGVFAPLARIRIAALERAAAEEEARKRGDEEKAKSEAEAKKKAEAEARKAEDEARKKADAEARQKAEEERKKAEDAKPDPRKQAQTANSWYAPERKRGLIAFAHKKATLEPGAVAALGRLAASVRDQRDYRIALVAGADRSEGVAAELQALSRARLAAIQEWLAGQGIAGTGVRAGIGPPRGEGPEHRFVAVSVDVAAPAPKSDEPASDPARGATARALEERLTGSQWGGPLSAAALNYSGFGAQNGFAAFIRVKTGGAIEIVASLNRVGTASSGAGSYRNWHGTWSIDGTRVCAAIGSIDDGQRRCYGATVNVDGSVTLSGAGLLDGKRFSK